MPDSFRSSYQGRFGMAVLGEDKTILTQTSANDLKLWLSMPSSEVSHLLLASVWRTALLQPCFLLLTLVLLQLFDLSIIHFLQKIRSQDVDIQVPVLSCSGKQADPFFCSAITDPLMTMFVFFFFVSYFISLFGFDFKKME
tara:strand:- start:385 stop:807 length:423 start_codon:yes stop_codon:yes gene_type:complete